MKKAYRIYWEYGSGKKSVDLTVIVIAESIEEAIYIFGANRPPEYIRNVEVMPETVLIAGIDNKYPSEQIPS